MVERHRAWKIRRKIISDEQSFRSDFGTPCAGFAINRFCGGNDGNLHHSTLQDCSIYLCGTKLDLLEEPFCVHRQIGEKQLIKYANGTSRCSLVPRYPGTKVNWKPDILSLPLSNGIRQEAYQSFYNGLLGPPRKSIISRVHYNEKSS